ncbi:hypothetical protein [Cupriavidus sp. UYPR2.512]|uniref:hypothetical protein n=1 Tax=Cupriavidus sp. UYPR2.512 TaxID=1080187 RepID=UPI0003627F79|nr:hypothetical protein [Cupriavidus sp. UYPR2.512]UIF90905.1 hypothetical protein KAF44_32485 [Cupriavidus necator]
MNGKKAKQLRALAREGTDGAKPLSQAAKHVYAQTKQIYKGLTEPERSAERRIIVENASVAA